MTGQRSANKGSPLSRRLPWGRREQARLVPTASSPMRVFGRLAALAVASLPALLALAATSAHGLARSSPQTAQFQMLSPTAGVAVFAGLGLGVALILLARSLELRRRAVEEDRASGTRVEDVL